MTMRETGRENVLEVLRSCSDFSDVRKAGILFHGTCEEITGELGGGGYDGVFWTAHSPDIAQAYIPKSGVTTWIHAPGADERDDRLMPAQNNGWLMRWALAKAGVTLEDLDITWNGLRPSSWTIPPGWPTEGDLDNHVKSLGYEADGMGLYTVSLSYRDGIEQIMPADWKLPGHLIVVLRKDMEITDPVWSEDALGYAPHNRIADFDRFCEAGIKAFRMGDQLQSSFQGNVDHEAVGILQSGREGLSWLAIEATRHDGPDASVWHGAETLEFAAFMKGINPAYRTALDIEKASRRYAVMCDSHRPFDKSVLARAEPDRSKASGFWVDKSPEDVWLMDMETAEEVCARLAFNNPRIVRENKAMNIIARQRDVDRINEIDDGPGF